MGLAASQARYLALTARKSDLEYQSQTINSRRIQLAYKTAEIAREYSDGMNNSRIKICRATVGEDGKSNPVWEELNFKNLYDEEYMVIGSQGAPLDPSPYILSNVEVDEFASSNNTVDENITPPKLTIEEIKSSDYKDIAFLYTPVYKKGADDDKTEIDYYQLRDNISKSEYEAIPADKQNYKNIFSPKKVLKTSYVPNPEYTKHQGADIQSLLVSGKAQIVTKGFFDFLRAKGYDFAKGIGTKEFYDLQQEWDNKQNGYNQDGKKSIIDWRSDETSTFASRTYTEDDEKVLAKYEAETAKVQAQDKQLEIEEKNIETQHKAIETEMENIKKVIQKNIEDTFKIFS